MLRVRRVAAVLAAAVLVLAVSCTSAPPRSTTGRAAAAPGVQNRLHQMLQHDNALGIADADETEMLQAWYGWFTTHGRGVWTLGL